MKNIYLLFFILVSFSGFTQNDIIGNWYLHYIENEGVQQYSTLPNSINPITFDTSNFDGQICMYGYTGNYIYNNDNTINIDGPTVLACCCDDVTESQSFVFPYFEIFNHAPETPYSYVISGTGNNETLTIINTDNNFAVYGRQALSTNELLGDWYLYSTNINGVNYNNTYDNNMSITFHVISHTPSNITGNGVCNYYESNYYSISNNEITTQNCSMTLADCDGHSFEVDHLYMIYCANDGNNLQTLEYQINGSNNDATLTVTNTINDNYAVYGRQALSINEYSLGTSLKINENPVKNFLDLSLPNDLNSLIFDIYSINGKLIKSNKITSNKIDVEYLSSGLYFIKVFNDKSSKTLKFVKE